MKLKSEQSSNMSPSKRARTACTADVPAMSSSPINAALVGPVLTIETESNDPSKVIADIGRDTSCDNSVAAPAFGVIEVFVPAPLARSDRSPPAGGYGGARRAVPTPTSKNYATASSAIPAVCRALRPEAEIETE
jgi:hypothetical protein